MTLNQAWTDISAAPDSKMERAIKRAAAIYDDYVLSFSSIPDNAFKFLEQLFSSKRVLASKGIENFLLEINVDLKKYSSEQLARLLVMLLGNADDVADKMGRHAIGDFVARAYPVDIVYPKIEAFADGTPRQKHVAFVAADIWRRRLDKGDPMHAKVARIWTLLQKSESDWFPQSK